jgi:hypothetical protein
VTDHTLVAADGDRRTDLVGVTSFGHTISVWWGRGDGTFDAEPARISPGRNEADEPITVQQVAVRDLNHDGARDLVTMNEDGAFSLISNAGGHSVGPAFPIFTGPEFPSVLAVGTFDADDTGDVVTGDDGAFQVYDDPPFGVDVDVTGFCLPDCPIVTPDAVPLPGASSLDFAVAGDFWPAGGAAPQDAVVALDAASETLWLLSRTPETGARRAWSFPAPCGSISLAAADFDGDGSADLAVTRGCNGRFASILLTRGGTPFGPPGFVPAGDAELPFSPEFVSVGDFDGNSRPDVVVTSADSDREVTVLLGNGDGTLQPPQLLDVPYGIGGVAAGDFDGDGRTDLAIGQRRVAEGGTAGMTILLSRGGAVDEPPVLTLPQPIAVEATGPDGAAVSFDVSASDAEDGTLAASCTPASGSVFPLGTTPVDCSATDAGGERASGSFIVTVRDTTPPALHVPAALDLDGTSPAGATVTFDATAADLVDGPVPVACTPPSGSLFASGTTSVDCTATDAHGNAAGGTFTVRVRTAAEQLERLRASVADAGPGRSLAAKLAAAQTALAAGDTQRACEILRAFANEARAQSGHTLTPDEAAALVAAAERIGAAAGC